jgi:hypothetical protein
MAGLVRMSLDSPEETRLFEGGTGQLQLVNMKEGGVGRPRSCRLEVVRAREANCHDRQLPG